MVKAYKDTVAVYVESFAGEMFPMHVGDAWDRASGCSPAGSPLNVTMVFVWDSRVLVEEAGGHSSRVFESAPSVLLPRRPSPTAPYGTICVHFYLLRVDRGRIQRELVWCRLSPREGRRRSRTGVVNVLQSIVVGGFSFMIPWRAVSKQSVGRARRRLGDGGSCRTP